MLYRGGMEETRLSKSRHGQLEYLTTMHYIRHLTPIGSKVLEVGAGTGRYSIELAKQGYQVTALELVADNLEVLQHHAAGLQNITAMQGDAIDLHTLADNSFDLVLLLGPMYHLYEKAEQDKALDEAIRVTKPNGIVITAFLSVYAMIHNNYLFGNLHAGMEENFDANFHVKHFTDQGFTAFDIAEFETLFLKKPTQKVALVGADGILELAEKATAFQMSEEEFELFAQYHLHTCEKRELLGNNSHLLYICRKNA